MRSIIISLLSLFICWDISPLNAQPLGRGIGVASSPKSSSTLTLGEYRALIIGINQYTHDGVWSSLKAARPDAEALRDILVDKYAFKPQNTTLLVDGQATRDKIIQSLYHLRKTSGQDDLILIYFAGHGNVIGDPRDPDASCWIPSDARSQKTCGDAINHAEIRELIKRFKAKHTLVIADACFGGNLMEPVKPKATRGASDASYLRSLLRPSKQILTSGVRKLEVSDKDPSTGHSPFASALLQTLRASDSFVSAVDLSVAVRRYYGDKSIDNSPVRGTLDGDQGGGFVFTPKAKLKTFSASGQSDKQRILELEAKLSEANEKKQIDSNMDQEDRVESVKTADVLKKYETEEHRAVIGALTFYEKGKPCPCEYAIDDDEIQTLTNMTDVEKLARRSLVPGNMGMNFSPAWLAPLHYSVAYAKVGLFEQALEIITHMRDPSFKRGEGLVFQPQGLVKNCALMQTESYIRFKQARFEDAMKLQLKIKNLSMRNQGSSEMLAACQSFLSHRRLFSITEFAGSLHEAIERTVADADVLKKARLHARELKIVSRSVQKRVREMGTRYTCDNICD